MNKVEAIARRVMGWRLHSVEKWFDVEKGTFIPIADFQPDKNIEHAMLIVDRLQEFGFTYKVDEEKKQVCFNDVCETGQTIEEAITNAAHFLADSSSSADEWL